MESLALSLLHALLATLLDAAPIVLVVGVFQTLILRRRPAHLPRVLIGAAYVVLGLALFRLGLEWSLLPIGADLSERLTAPGLAAASEGEEAWRPSSGSISLPPCSVSRRRWSSLRLPPSPSG